MSHQALVQINKKKNESIQQASTASKDINTKKQNRKTPKYSFFDKMSYATLFFLMALLPVFVLSQELNLQIGISKIILLSFGVVIALIFWLIGRFRDGVVVLPKSWILGIGGLLAVTFLISALFSVTPEMSLMGLIMETGTASSIFTLVFLMALASLYFQKEGRSIYFYTILLLLSFVLFFYQIFRTLIIVEVFPPEWIAKIPQNLFGEWNDLAVFFALTALLVSPALDILRSRIIIKIILYLSLAISLLSMLVISFFIGWVVLGIISLIAVVYILLFKEENKKYRLPIASLIVLIVSLFAIAMHSPINDFSSKHTGIPQETLHPSWTETLVVAEHTLRESPVLGAGPNRFAAQWALFKPTSVNDSQFWMLDFDFGAGVIPTFGITTGLLGLLVFCLFIAVYLRSGVRALFYTNKDMFMQYRLLSAFLASFFLWIILFVYVANIVILGLAFFITGIFIAELVNAKIINNKQFFLSRKTRKGFASLVFLILVMIVIVVWSFFMVQKSTAIFYVQKSFNTENIAEAQELMSIAVFVDSSDVFYRRISELYMLNAQGVLSDEKLSQEEVRNQFQLNTSNAIRNALKARDKNPLNYQNLLTLGSHYQALGEAGLSEGYKNARESYKLAQLLNPNNPNIPLLLAHIAWREGDIELSRKYIERSLFLKDDFVQAFFLLSQIEASKGNLREAIIAAESVTIALPNDARAFFQLGLLNYQDNNYENAIISLERSVALQPNYSNAKYFLGLSYNRVGRKEEAVIQIEGVFRLNPNNEEVSTVLKKMIEGKDIFVGDLKNEESSVGPERLITDEVSPN